MHLQNVSTQVSLSSLRRLTWAEHFCHWSIFRISKDQSKFSRVLYTIKYIDLQHYDKPIPCSSVSCIVDLRTGGRWFESLAQPIFSLRIDGSHCDRIHSSLTTVHCFKDGYMGKQPLAWKEYCAEYWLTFYHIIPTFNNPKDG